MLHKHFTVQVVDFMLQTHRKQLVAVDFKSLAIQIQGANTHAVWASHNVVHFRDRQAALFPFFLLKALSYDFGVDEDLQLVTCFTRVHHHNAFVYVHLCGCKADAIGFVHGFAHVRSDLADALINDGDGFCNFVQAWVGKF